MTCSKWDRATCLISLTAHSPNSSPPNIDIDDPAYAVNGRSKGKRLRCFLQTVDDRTAARTLEALWEYREAIRLRMGNAETVSNAAGRLLELLDRIKSGQRPAAQVTPPPAFNVSRITELRADLLALSNLEPQPRGYAFEAFLKKLFDAFGLKAQEAFRNKGEQIDGSFLLNNEVYLIEAKWQSKLVDISDLHTFHGKIEQKAMWTRGLIVSHAGFSEDGLHAFGRGKRVICMDGFDLYETLDRQIPLNHVLERKVRRAGETGDVFARVRDLF